MILARKDIRVPGAYEGRLKDVPLFEVDMTVRTGERYPRPPRQERPVPDHAVLLVLGPGHPTDRSSAELALDLARSLPLSALLAGQEESDGAGDEDQEDQEAEGEVEVPGQL